MNEPTLTEVLAEVVRASDDFDSAAWEVLAFIRGESQDELMVQVGDEGVAALQGTVPERWLGALLYPRQGVLDGSVSLGVDPFVLVGAAARDAMGGTTMGLGARFRLAALALYAKAGGDAEFESWPDDLGVTEADLDAAVSSLLSPNPDVSPIRDARVPGKPAEVIEKCPEAARCLDAMGLAIDFERLAILDACKYMKVPEDPWARLSAEQLRDDGPGFALARSIVSDAGIEWTPAEVNAAEPWDPSKHARAWLEAAARGEIDELRDEVADCVDHDTNRLAGKHASPIGLAMILLTMRLVREGRDAAHAAAEDVGLSGRFVDDAVEAICKDDRTPWQEVLSPGYAGFVEVVRKARDEDLSMQLAGSVEYTSEARRIRADTREYFVTRLREASESAGVADWFVELAARSWWPEQRHREADDGLTTKIVDKVAEKLEPLVLAGDARAIAQQVNDDPLRSAIAARSLGLDVDAIIADECDARMAALEAGAVERGRQPEDLDGVEEVDRAVRDDRMGSIDDSNFRAFVDGHVGQFLARRALPGSTGAKTTTSARPRRGFVTWRRRVVYGAFALFALYWGIEYAISDAGPEASRGSSAAAFDPAAVGVPLIPIDDDSWISSDLIDGLQFSARSPGTNGLDDATVTVPHHAALQWCDDYLIAVRSMAPLEARDRYTVRLPTAAESERFDRSGDVFEWVADGGAPPTGTGWAGEFVVRRGRETARVPAGGVSEDAGVAGTGFRVVLERRP